MTEMKKWQLVRRMTPHQKGKILERLGNSYVLAKHHKYVVLHRATDEASGYILRRCPHWGYIDIWYTRLPLHVNVSCGLCGKFSLTT